jgi:hypothetical protein
MSSRSLVVTLRLAVYYVSRRTAWESPNDGRPDEPISATIDDESESEFFRCLERIDQPNKLGFVGRHGQRRDERVDAKPPRWPLRHEGRCRTIRRPERMPI